MRLIVEGAADIRQYRQEGRPILIVFIDRLLTVTPGGDVVQRAGKFQSKRSRPSSILRCWGVRLPNPDTP